MQLLSRAFSSLSPRQARAANSLGFAVLSLALALSLAFLPVRAAEPEPTKPDQADPDAGTAGEEAPSGVEVITVKGVSQVAPEVSVSATQFDLKELSALGAQNLGDLARVTPNLEIKSLTSTTPTFFIRGVGLNDFSANAAGAVAIYNDGVPLNAPALQLGQIFDVENVEVLRGPQGYGDHRNASGGAIETITRKPTGQYEASVIADFGNYDAKDFQGSLSAPIVADVLSARGSFRVTERGPLIRNRCGGVIDTGTRALPGEIACNETASGRNTLIPTGLPDHVNDRSRWAARGLLRLQPPESEMDWLLNVHGGVIDEDATLGQVVGIGSGVSGAPGTASGYTDPDVGRLFQQIRPSVLNSLPPSPNRGILATLMAREQTLAAIARDIDLADPFENDYDLVGQERLKTYGGSLRGEFAVGPVIATTITGAERFIRSRDRDVDYSSNPMIHIFTDDEAWQATENLGFEWEPDFFPGTLRWGGYYLREELSSDGLFDLQPVGFTRIRTLQSYEQDLDSFGVHGSFSWDLLDDVTLEGGVRYNWEQKTFETLVQDEQAALMGRLSRPVGLDETWSAPTGGLNLTYFFTRDITAYVKYTRGWKAGHIQANSLRNDLDPTTASTTTTAPTIARPETIDAFEIGSRGRWLDNRLQLGGSLFYYSYRDYQVFVFENQAGSPPQLKIINANDARVFGAEADLRVEPLRGWAPRLLERFAISGRFGWIESEFLDFSDVRNVAFPLLDGSQVFISTNVDFTGNRLPNTPRYKVSGTVEAPIDLERWGTFTLRYDINWTDDIFFDPSDGRGVSTNNSFFRGITLPEYAVGQRAYALHDLRLSYRIPSSSVEISGYVRNLENKVYKTYVADTTVAFQSFQNLVGEPRTYGASLSILF